MTALIGRLGRSLIDQPYLLLTLTALLWGGNAVAGKLAVGEISPMLLTGLRWALACSALALLFGRKIRAEVPALLPHWRMIGLMGAFGFTVFNALFYAAAHHTSAVNLTIIQGSIPVVVLIGALLIFGTSIRAMQVLGMVVTIAGVLVTASHGEIATLTGLAFNIGDVWMLIACLFYAGYTLGLRQRPPVSGIVFFSAMAGVAFLTTLPLMAWEYAAGFARWPTLQGWLVLIYVAFAPSLIAQIMFMRGVELIGPGRAGIFVNLVPIFGALLAVLILSEPFALYHALALALVFGGIWLAEQSGRRV